MIYLQLFYTFFKIGLFGFGGGYAMLSMIQGEVVNERLTKNTSVDSAGRCLTSSLAGLPGSVRSRRKSLNSHTRRSRLKTKWR